METGNRIRNYNMAITISYLKYSYISISAFACMLIMFIISVAMTYDGNAQTGQKYGVTHISPLVLIRLGANVGFYVKYGQVYRLVTAIFLHAGIQHFFVNSLSMFGLLMNVEGQFKKSVFAVTFLAGGIQGNLLSLFANFIK